MSDHDQLEAILLPSGFDDLDEGVCQPLNILGVKVRCGLIQGEDPTVLAERLCQAESHDDWAEHFLACWASSFHL